MIRARILGCGSSGGVPRIGNVWGACDPNEPKNTRMRCSLLVEQVSEPDVTTVLVDTSPDLRQQLLAADVSALDAVLYTHDHADQCHGIDDLRVVAYGMQRLVDVYADDVTAQSLLQRFGYCFKQPHDSPYVPILTLKDELKAEQAVTIEGKAGPLTALPFLQDHGSMESLGFRFGDLAYSSDLVGLPEKSFELLQNLDVWIVDALRYTPHPTHAHLDLVLNWVERLRPRRTVLTNLHIDMDYQTLLRDLPDGVEPAFDGMTINSH